MTYESAVEVESKIAPGVRFTVAKMSFGRRMELMRRIRELGRRMEFFEAGQQPGEKMDAALLRAEIDRLYLTWGLRAVSGLVLDGGHADPELLAEAGPEELVRKATAAVRAEAEMTHAGRTNR